MANGTIAFDTLQTSGQITGTAKSVDTDYVVNGSAKSWLNLNGESTIATRDSFNISGTTDNGTGDYSINVSSAMGNTSYVLATNGKQGDNNNFESNGLATAARPISSSSYRQYCRQSHYEVGSSRDFFVVDSVVLGDLA